MLSGHQELSAETRERLMKAKERGQRGSTCWTILVEFWHLSPADVGYVWSFECLHECSRVTFGWLSQVKAPIDAKKQGFDAADHHHSYRGGPPGWLVLDFVAPWTEREVL